MCNSQSIPTSRPPATKKQLSGEVHTWELFDQKRQLGVVILPFGEASQYLKPVLFDGARGTGQQREIVQGHVRKLKTAMENGSYTPTPASANLDKAHRKGLVMDNREFILEVSSEQPLLLTDAGHRFEALRCIANELEEKFASAKDGKDKEKQKGWLDQVLRAPVTITLYFDGDAGVDFVNLQQGRPVDAAHMLSLKVQQKLLDDPSFRLSFDIAKVLNKQNGSPFQNTIRFDSRGDASLPISTLCSKGSSDLGTSLVGLAKVGLAGEMKDAAVLAGAVVAAYKALQTDVGILKYGKVLTPISEGGKRGQATMLIGLAVCLAYRLSVLGRTEATEDDLVKLVTAAKQTLDVPVGGNLSGPAKRKLLGEFAKMFLADLTLEKHDGLPVGLLKALSSSTFAVESLPKEKKAAPAPAPKQDTVEPQQRKVLPDIDGPVSTVTNEPIPIAEREPFMTAVVSVELQA